MFKLIKRSWIIILLIVLFIPAVWDLLKPGYFPMHDDMQIFRLYEFDKCIKDGQIPCRWVPDGGYGYGYPLFQFYPPLPYYLAETFLLVGFNFFWSIKIVFILAFIISGLAMYLFAKKFFGKLAGIVAAVFYVYAPYHSVDIYVRGAMNEAWGMVWFPLILLYSYQLTLSTENKYQQSLVKLALSSAGLLLSHNVMALILAPLLGLWLIFWLFINKSWFRIKTIFLSGLLAVGLAAFFFIPVVLEGKYVHVETMTIGYFNYLAHFADLNQLFISRFWGYGGSTWGPNDDMAFPIGHLHWFFASLVLILAIIKFKKFKSISSMIFLIFFSGMIYLFLTHSRSVWFWDNLPLLYFAQFPWRLLAMVVFCFSFLVAALFFFLNNKSKIRSQAKSRFAGLNISLASILITSVILWNLPFFKIEKQLNITEAEKFSGHLWELQVTGGIFDYLPKSASRPPGDPGFTIPQFLTGNGGIINYQTGSNWLSFEAKVSTDNADIIIPQYDFPGMVVSLDGKPVSYQTDPDLGRIIIKVPQGDVKVDLVLKRTFIRTLADLITFLSIIILICYLCHGKRKSS